METVVNKTWNNAKRAKTKRDHLINAVMGLASESGELLDEHKKLFFHTKKDRLKEISLEIGDIFYYLIKVMDIYGFTTKEILDVNRAKLFERYGIKE